MTEGNEVSGRHMRRAAWASLVGNVIEYYDFLIYGTAAALVFQKVFFPELGAAQGTALALATFGVAFLTRPIGAIVFGHFGDRIGRRTTLVSTLLLMGLSTTAVGLVPGTGTIGVAAPVIIICLRVVQGIAVGGEWAGAALLVAENAAPRLRGRYSLYPQQGPALGLVLSSATIFVVNRSMSAEAFLEYGWRIPFLLSAVLVVVGLYVRLKLGETAAFRGGRTAPTRPPVVESIRRQPKEILLVGGAVATCFMLFNGATSYLPNAGVAGGVSRGGVLASTIAGGLVLSLAVVVFAIRSDRLGRRTTILIGNLAAVVFGVVVVPLLHIGQYWSYLVCVVLAMLCTGIAYGPLAAFVPEMFPTRYRYTGAGMAYNLGGVLGGALTPLVMVALQPLLGGYAVGLFMALFALASVACTLALPETRDRELDAVGEPAPATGAERAG